MRLHTDFHDYYDSAIGYGVDEKVHYNRFKKDADILLKSVADRPVHRRSGILGFCGNLYPFIEISHYDKKRECDLDDEFDGKIVQVYFAFSLEEYKKKEHDWYDYSDDFEYFDNTEKIKLKQFFLDWRTSSDEMFLSFRCPVWMMHFYKKSPNGVLNPRLKNLGFDRIKSPFDAFQEISMYVSNILVEQKPVASVEDKYRIQQHGFDLKESFRRPKKRS